MAIDSLLRSFDDLRGQILALDAEWIERFNKELTARDQQIEALQAERNALAEELKGVPVQPTSPPDGSAQITGGSQEPGS